MICDLIDVFFLEIVYDDLISFFELIEQSKYGVIFTFDPWIVRRMPEDKYISLLSWLCCTRIAYDSLTQLLHEYLMHRRKVEIMFHLDIDERYILTDTRDDDSILIWSDSKCSTLIFLFSILYESPRSIISRIYDRRIRSKYLRCDRFQIISTFAL
jgi:hypothetical protein